jgi:hypothetical protein
MSSLTIKELSGGWQTYRNYPRAPPEVKRGGLPKREINRRVLNMATEYVESDAALVESAKMAAAERKAAEHQAFADKLAKRSPPHPVERAEIEKARRRTKARAPRVAMHIEDREAAGRALYPDHSDDEGHEYRLTDAFGTRSLQFVYEMLNGLGNATADHSLDYDFNPGRANEIAFNAALAVISGVRPKDEIEAMLAAHMAVTNIALLELVARTRGSIANHKYEGGDGIKRLDGLGNLTNKFMRTYIKQVEALTRKRRKGEQNIRVKHVHVYAGGQAIVGNVRHRGGRGTAKNEQRAYERKKAKPATRAIPDSPSVRGANKERAALPVASDKKGPLSIARRRKR